MLIGRKKKGLAKPLEYPRPAPRIVRWFLLDRSVCDALFMCFVLVPPSFYMGDYCECIGWPCAAQAVSSVPFSSSPWYKHNV